MNQTIVRYLLPVLKRRLDMEMQRWNSALESGFDVVLVVNEDALADVLSHLLVDGNASILRSSCKIAIYDTQGQCVRSGQTLGHPQNSSTQTALPTLSVIRESPNAICGAIPFELPPLSTLFPSAAQMVSLVLEKANLIRYVDAFDGKKLAALKKILEIHGHELFFDSIVQVAYKAGFRGEDEGALEFLESRITQPVVIHKRRPAKTEHVLTSESAHGIADLFDKILRYNDPHDVLKASLTHYVFHGRRVTQAEASRILKVSRSTLQAHLHLAEHLNVAELFHNPETSA